MFLHIVTLCKISMRFASIFPWLWDLSVPVPTQFLGEHTVRLPSWCWKLFKHASNHAVTVQPGTHSLLGQESVRVYRWHVWPNDTVPHCGNQDPYLGPRDPKMWAAATQSRCPACVVHILDIGRVKVVTAMSSSLVLLRPTPSQWDGTTIYVVLRATRDTQPPVLKGENESPQTFPATRLEPGPPVWEVHALWSMLLDLHKIKQMWILIWIWIWISSWKGKKFL